jgi:hypothetical protein
MIHNKVEDYLCTVIERVKKDTQFNLYNEFAGYHNIMCGIIVKNPSSWFKAPYWRLIKDKIRNYYIITEEEQLYYIYEQLLRWVDFKVNNGEIEGKSFK